MRISDWSSDVCSSDLVHSSHAMGGQTRRVPARELVDIGFGKGRKRPGRVGGILGAAVGDADEVGVLQVGRRPDFGQLIHLVVEIGRASGRERGGQYVDILGVGVTLKKKKKIKT